MTGRAPIGPRFTVALPTDLREALRRQAKAEKVSTAELIRQAITELLAARNET